MADAARDTDVTGHTTADEVAGWLQRLATGADLGPLGEAAPAELCDLLRELELLKNATSAAQARVTLLAAGALREQAVDAGTPTATADKGVAQQLGLARRESPHLGSRHIGFARVIVREMPALHSALTAGLIAEWSATQIVAQTACLSLEHRQMVDAHLAGRLANDSHRALLAAAKAKAYELDPYSFTKRGRKAVGDRRVSVRPAPDVMAIVSGYVPVAQGVACYKALDEAAKAAKSAGDERSMDQIRADIFTQRLTGQSAADDVSIEVGLVMTDLSLLGLDETPARLEGYGPIPAPLARDLLRELDDGCDTQGDTTQTPEEQGTVRERLARQAKVWLRRLYADPATGVLTNQDDRRRAFTGHLRRFLIARDQVCRTPWCDAPVRHVDHVVPWARGGRTTADGGEGMCEACNYAKESSGWSHEVVDLPDGTHTVKITTPTGHSHYSQPPPILPTLADQSRSVPAGADLGISGPTLPDPSESTLPDQGTSGSTAADFGATGAPRRATAMARGGSAGVITLRLRPDEGLRSPSDPRGSTLGGPHQDDAERAARLARRRAMDRAGSAGPLETHLTHLLAAA